MNTYKKKIAIIPARGGSKRIPRKNIRLFLGKPIIGYPIDLALKSALFDEVMVSTDDEEIAEIARSYGANVPFFRSKENAGDHAGTSEVIQEVINNYTKHFGVDFEFACCIYPTTPLLTYTVIEDGLNLLISNNYSTVFPVVKYSYPIQRSLKMNVSTYQVEMNWPENYNKRSQDLEATYHDSGQFYWINLNRFWKDPVLFSKDSGGLLLSELRTQDIDNEQDWALAELKYSLHHRGN